MGINKEIKKVDVELQIFMKNVDQGIHALAERLHNLYIEHDKLAKRVDDLENKSGGSNVH